jgi:hypothetical protein
MPLYWTFGEKAYHPEPMCGVYPERSEWAQGKLRAGSGAPDAQTLRCAQDDRQDTAHVRSRELLSPNVCCRTNFHTSLPLAVG